MRVPGNPLTFIVNCDLRGPDRLRPRNQYRPWSATLVVLPALFYAFVNAGAAMAQSTGAPGSSGNGLQLAQPIEPGQTSPHLTITLQDALDRAEKNDATFSAAVTDARMAREDHVQMRAAGLPSVGLQTSALLDQGNGKIPTGRYVTEDGVHVYRQWGVVHQDLSLDTLTMVGDRKGAALEALARAKQEIARRGLKVTVTKDYYALVVSQRKYATAEESLKQAERFLAMTKDQESQGQAAHSDVIKAQIQFNQGQTVLDDSRLQMENDRLTLAVLLFPTLTENFSVVDDLDQGQDLPPLADVRAMAARENPDVRVALETLKTSNLSVTAARSAMLPSISADLDYGIEANRFALRSVAAEYPEQGIVPNVGYFATLTLNLPVWDWGTLRSKLRQAEYQRQQARVELTLAQRQAVSELYSLYNEAQTAKSAVDNLRETSNLAGEAMRLTTLRYQAGQASAFEVVDAQNTLTQARNAYDDGQLRFRLAVAQLQTLTGSF
jgi:outer membrane protein TolC